MPGPVLDTWDTVVTKTDNDPYPLGVNIWQEWQTWYLSKFSIMLEGNRYCGKKERSSNIKGIGGLRKGMGQSTELNREGRQGGPD